VERMFGSAAKKRYWHAKVARVVASSPGSIPPNRGSKSQRKSSRGRFNSVIATDSEADFASIL
jgi:hypothetical protein